MRIADLSTVELQRVGRAILQAYLDAQAGRPEALARWMIDGVSAAVPTSGSNTDRLGPVTVLRQGTDRAHMASTVLDVHGTTTGSIACEVHSDDGLRVVRIGQVPVTATELDSSTRWILEPEPPEYLTSMLGPLPNHEAARMRWLTAAAIVAEYRETWAVEDVGSALGAATSDPEQRKERQGAVDSLRALRVGLEPLEHDDHVLGMRTGEPELGL